jgi:hypothetical protein
MNGSTCMPLKEVALGFLCTSRTSFLWFMTTRLAEGRGTTGVFGAAIAFELMVLRAIQTFFLTQNRWWRLFRRRAAVCGNDKVLMWYRTGNLRSVVVGQAVGWLIIDWNLHHVPLLNTDLGDWHFVFPTGLIITWWAWSVNMLDLVSGRKMDWSW